MKVRKGSAMIVRHSELVGRRFNMGPVLDERGDFALMGVVQPAAISAGEPAGEEMVGSVGLTEYRTEMCPLMCPPFSPYSPKSMGHLASVDS